MAVSHPVNDGNQELQISKPESTLQLLIVLFGSCLHSLDLLSHSKVFPPTSVDNFKSQWSLTFLDDLYKGRVPSAVFTLSKMHLLSTCSTNDRLYIIVLLSHNDSLIHIVHI